MVVEILFSSGEKLSQRIDFPKGSPKNPYSQNEMLLKLFTTIGDRQQTEKLIMDIRKLAIGTDVYQFLSSYAFTL